MKINFQGKIYSIDRNLNLKDIQYSHIYDDGIFMSIPLKNGKIVKRFIPHYNKMYPAATCLTAQKIFKKAVIVALVGDPRKKEIKELKRRIDILECHVNALMEANTLVDKGC